MPEPVAGGVGTGMGRCCAGTCWITCWMPLPKVVPSKPCCCVLYIYITQLLLPSFTDHVRGIHVCPQDESCSTDLNSLPGGKGFC
jgi:hypothetical protein